MDFVANLHLKMNDLTKVSVPIFLFKEYRRLDNLEEVVKLFLKSIIDMCPWSILRPVRSSSTLGMKKSGKLQHFYSYFAK